jgi:hypothetical protein
MISKPVVALLIGLNLVLAAALVWAFKRPSSAPEPKGTGETASADSMAAKTTTPVNLMLPATDQKFSWNTVESEDYKRYIANLRAIGCPEETIRDIIIADINKLFAARKHARHVARTNQFEYWKAGNFFASLAGPERIEQNQALAREKHELFRILLGAVPEEKSDLLASFNPFENMLDFLPAEKQTAVTELYQKYQAKQLQGLSGGTPDAEDLQQMAKTQKELERELGKLLTVQELEDYQLRMSQTAMVMRMQLASFEPTEEEFRTIFKAKKMFDDEFGLLGLGATDSAEQAKLQAAQQQLNDTLRKILGETRYAEYERAQDYNYQTIYRIADRNGLGPEAAGKVYEIKKIAEEQALLLRRDATLSLEQRGVELRNVRAETESAIQTVFGKKAAQAYQNQGGHWLQSISPDPK